MPTLAVSKTGFYPGFLPSRSKCTCHHIHLGNHLNPHSVRAMHPLFEELLANARLTRIAGLLCEWALPAVGMSLQPASVAQPLGASKLGGRPDLPRNFVWPTNKGRPLDFLLQINLAEAQQHDSQGILPASGLLTFLYDLDDQPWGYDPADLDGFRVIHTPDPSALQSHDVPHNEFVLAEYSIHFHSMQTLPHFGSRAADSLEAATQLTDEETDSYFELPSQFEGCYSPPGDAGNHHLLGHSANVQGDMQLEAQLVTNGLYCGDPSGYEDPRRKTLESGADDWVLLLQLDTDENANVMWGDCGMLYYWIRKDDLANRRFDNVWMTLQCY